MVTTASQLASVAANLGPPATKAEVDEIINGRFVITKGLIDLIKENQSDLLERAANVLLKRGYGLSAEQSDVVRQVKHSLENKERKIYLVKGESGSGKTLVALTLLFEAISRNHKALLGYRNNRLLHTLKTVLKVKRGKVSLASLIQFYSMGAMRGFKGIGEPNFPMETFSPPDDPLELVIFDEALRMTDSVIQTSMTRAPVSVYFYDESQILIGDEQGTRENLERYAKDATEVTLSSPFRAPKSYLDFVDRLLEGKGGPMEKYDFRTYADVGDLLKDLGAKEREKFRVALVAAFTESDGNRKDASSSKNVRLGYPLQSGFDLYRGLGTDVRWLMDERVQYPRYWMGLLDPLKYCASVYGAQGFEADYVGVIWGRDFVRRSGVWVVDPRVVTDRIGGKYSLKTIAQRDPSQATLLLKNRYYVLLTRGIRGTFVFFEDAKTRDFVENSVRKEEVLAQ